MEISVWQAILIGFVYYLGINGTPWITLVGTHGWMRPMVNGLVVGLIMGDPVGGTIIGTAITIPYLGFISAGGTVPMDPAFAGTVGTALALSTGASPGVATSLAVPIGLLGTVIWILHMTVDSTFVHMADQAAEEGDLDKINWVTILLPQLFLILISVIPVAVAVYFGTDLVQSILNALEGRPLEVMNLIGGLLPALGIAMNLRAMSGAGLLVFFVFGFLLTQYSGLSILAVSLFAAIFAYVYTKLSYGSENGGLST